MLELAHRSVLLRTWRNMKSELHRVVHKYAHCDAFLRALKIWTPQHTLRCAMLLLHPFMDWNERPKLEISICNFIEESILLTNVMRTYEYKEVSGGVRMFVKF